MTKTTRAALLVSLVLLAVALVAPAVAAAAPALVKAPLDPAFRQDLATGSDYVHSPVAVDARPAALPMLRAGNLPSSYDLRNVNGVRRVTPVRDQWYTGTCWAFAAMGALESRLMPAKVWDFSEDNLVNRNGFLVGDRYQDGGTLQMAEAYLARWNGPLAETADPFPTYRNPVASKTSPARPVLKHVQGFVLIPPRADFSQDGTANDAIKFALMRYGAVATQMYFPETDSGSEYTPTLGFYQPSVPTDADGVPEANHGVDIVGWDDAYPAAQFATQAPGPGAFLVRNSWGASFGDAGYFWISYYDAALARSDMSMAFSRVDPVGTYRRTYGYDRYGWTDSVGLTGTSDAGVAKFASRFTAKAAEHVAAVSFYTIAANAAYKVYAGPSLGRLTLRGAGTVPQAGYVTARLSTRLKVTKGKPFVVAVRLDVPGTDTPIPLEDPIPGYDNATAKAGQSYVRIGSRWVDVTTTDASYANTNVCLKAFTVR